MKRLILLILFSILVLFSCKTTANTEPQLKKDEIKTTKSSDVNQVNVSKQDNIKIETKINTEHKEESNTEYTNSIIKKNEPINNNKKNIDSDNKIEKEKLVINNPKKEVNNT